MAEKTTLYRMGILIFLVVVLGIGANLYFTVNPIEKVNVGRAILSLMMIAVGLIPFYGVMGLGLSNRDRSLSKQEIRLAIVIAIITMYLVMVGTVTFFTSGKDLPPITETILNHFTTVVGVLIAFYFGATAYEAVHKQENQSDDKPDGQSEEKSGKSKSGKQQRS